VEVKQINQLMVSMQRYGIKRLSLKKEGVEIELEREDHFSLKGSSMAPEGQGSNPLRVDFEKRRAHGRSSVEQSRSSEEDEEPSKAEEDESVFIASPMVGTFYQSPSPSAPAFIKEGDRVNENTIVGLVEAMKVMNEVKSGVQGVVAEVFVENAQAVEFGTRLFRVIPNS